MEILGSKKSIYLGKRRGMVSLIVCLHFVTLLKTNVVAN